MSGKDNQAAHVAVLEVLQHATSEPEVYAALTAAIAAMKQQGEPVAWQFKDDDGKWCNFHSDKHRDDTIADGRWEVRALYAAPTEASR
jgi:hypothetical protein